MVKTRNKRVISKLAVFCLGLLVLFISPTALFAAFSVSAVPFEGGYDLRFGKISLAAGRINKELIVTVTSDISTEYRLIQTLLEPLSSVSGKTLPGNNFLVYGLRGTNKFGTLNVEQEIPVGLGRQVIYTSNQSGNPDSFTLVYGLIPSQDIEPGSYRGRIGFTLEPINSGQPPVTVILNILAEIGIESAIEVTTETGTKNISLSSDKPESGVSRVMINIRGSFGSQFRILQSSDEQPVSNTGELLDYNAVNFIGLNAQKGTVVNQPQSLSAPGSPQVIYTSSSDGEADSFVIEYRLNPSQKQPAGLYRGRIKYALEGIGSIQPRIIDTLRLEIENTRIFELVITPEPGGLIRFNDVKLNQPPQTSELLVEIKTNIGRQYQINQHLYSSLANKDSEVIPAKNFTLRQETIDTKGTLKFTAASEVKTGDTVLFVSDKDGSPDKFKLVYELTATPEVKAGDYSTQITYSISEI
jgi:hypothetical protein